jgi:hypothetical protein
MRTISTYSKSGRLFILRVMAIFQQVCEFSAESPTRLSGPRGIRQGIAIMAGLNLLALAQPAAGEVFLVTITPRMAAVLVAGDG